MAEVGQIHPTAVVEPGADIDPTARVGPCAVIGAAVRIGAGCEIDAHVVIRGDTVLGPGCRVASHAVLGTEPQVRRGASSEGGKAPGSLRLGHDTWVREHVTVHVGTAGGQTVVGAGCLLMAYSHVAHDCRIGEGVELANGVQLAGHVEVQDRAALGGLSAVHQFVRIGRMAFVGAGAMVSQDVLPFALASGDRARVYGVNTVGMKRHGLDGERRRALRCALRLLLGAPTLAQGLEAVLAMEASCEELEQMVSFARISRRGLCRLTQLRSTGAGT